jgi:predicted nucleotidyltransferase component of viral defense system
VDHYGTPVSQVQRDHLLSHVLARLPDLVPGATFSGGTALCRTHLPDWRLSEDIDLLVDDRDATERPWTAAWQGPCDGSFRTSRWPG